MPVVINEFEALADEAAPPPRAAGREPSAEGPAPAPVDPHALAEALRTLEEQALRAWAH